MVGLPPSHNRTPDSDMGHFRVAVQIGNRAGERFEPVEALVDTGATYTWIPRDVLRRLGVTPEEEWPFVLADGREVRYPVAWMLMRIGERTNPTVVVFGEPGSEPMLGVFALEGFRLAVDPVNRRLVSVPGLLKRVADALPRWSRVNPRLGRARERTAPRGSAGARPWAAITPGRTPVPAPPATVAPAPASPLRAAQR